MVYPVCIILRLLSLGYSLGVFVYPQAMPETYNSASAWNLKVRFQLIDVLSNNNENLEKPSKPKFKTLFSNSNLYFYVCVYISVCMCVYIYAYVIVHIYVCVCVMCIMYIYTYISTNLSLILPEMPCFVIMKIVVFIKYFICNIIIIIISSEHIMNSLSHLCSKPGDTFL